jgi:hypothetical protein
MIELFPFLFFEKDDDHRHFHLRIVIGIILYGYFTR